MIKNKPRIFIGSSIEGLNIAYAIQQNLNHDAEVTVWDQGVFELSLTSIESLVNNLDQFDFAIFVLSPDDISKIRSKRYATVRDNVIFELGLFIGKIGRNRTFLVTPDNSENLHIATDLLGITMGKYETTRTDGSFQAATGPICFQIKQLLKKMGPIMRNNTVTSIEVKEDKEEKISSPNGDGEDNWYDLVSEKRYADVYSLIEKEISLTKDPIRLDYLQRWKIYLALKENLKKGKKMAQEYIEKERKSAASYSQIGHLYLLSDELESAMEVIENGLAKDKNNIDLKTLKCDYLDRIGRTKDAIILMKELDYKNDVDICIQLVEYYEAEKNEGDLKSAYEVLLECYKNNQDSEELTFKLSRICQETYQDNTALYLLNKLVKKHPNNATYWGYLGSSCFSLGLENMAMTNYQKSGKITNYEEEWISSNMGNILLNKGLYSEAKAHFAQALSIDKNSEYALSRTAQAIKQEEEEEERFSKLLKDGLNKLLTDYDELDNVTRPSHQV